MMERPKRQKRETSKSKAFERLKELKSGGIKHKYEITPLENVYEEVSEKEYTEAVLKRQEDDWIVDDYGAEGYVEDGREIFDDDLDEESIKKERKISKKRDYSGTPKGVEAPKGNIRKMLSNMPIKKKEVKIDADNVLNDLLKELDQAPSTNEEKSEKSEKSEVESWFSSYTMPLKTPKPQIKAVQSIELKPAISDEANVQSIKLKSTISDEETISEIVSDIEMTFSNVSTAKSEPEVPNGNISEILPEISTEFLNNSMDLPEPAVPDIKAASKVTSEIEMEFINIPTKTSEPVTANAETISQISKFFLWDAYEDIYNQPGTVYLFGKIYLESSKAYASCCVIVKNIERKIYLLPREKKYSAAKKQLTDEDVEMLDVYNEFNERTAERFKIMSFKSRKVTKNYAFDIADVPDTCEYFEVRYSAKSPALPGNLSGETFSRVFGTNTSFLELFLIEKRIKGPCWLELNEPGFANSPASWCKYEVIVEDMNNIKVLKNAGPPPPLVVVTMNMRITPLPKSHDNQITMIGCLVHNNYYTDKAAPTPPFEQHFCAFTKPGGLVWPYDFKEVAGKFTAVKLEKMESERALLSFFLAKFHKIDPDLVVGHDIYGFDIGTLIHRLTANKTPHPSRLGRLRRANLSSVGRSKGFAERNAMCGRLLCDIRLSAKELIRARSYDLDTLCQQVLHMKEAERNGINSDDIKAKYNSSSSIISLIKSTMQDASYILRIMYDLNVIPLSLQITNIAGNVLSRTLMGGRSERNEFLLLHAFNEKDYIVPDKAFYKKPSKEDTHAMNDPFKELEATGKGKRKPQYEGGLVLEPKIGFYDKLILLMDFNSLYPSIIQEYNICFTTIPIRGLNFNNEGDVMMLMNRLPSSSQPGILPTEIRKLVESRRDVKKLMANPNVSTDLKHQYDIRQTALKITANSMYGCLGFQYSRFYAKPLAAMVTAKGREILVNTRDLVQRLNFEVIYGDTDSLMINTNCLDYDEVFKVGHKIKVEVNKLYKQIELDIDGVFKSMLLLKKKKYAAVSLSKVNGQLLPKREIKGLDLVRRDWSQFATKVGTLILDQILSNQNLEDKLENIHALLSKFKADLEENKIPLDYLAITKQLTKDPEEYSDKKSLTHVQVALRMNSTMTKKFKQGDTIAYVICEDGTSNAATARAYHVSEMANNENLKIDFKYYLSQQVHPVVTRLCEPIDGIDSVQIAELLGLDTSAYRHIRRLDQTVNEEDEINLDDADRYKDCEKFEFKCVNEKCLTTNVIESPLLKKENGEYDLALNRCSNPQCDTPPFVYVARLLNSLIQTIRSFIHKYYLNWMICEEPTCAYRTRVTRLLNKASEPMCSQCKRNILIREYTEGQLYTQLCYFQYMFDIDNALSNCKTLTANHNSDEYMAYCKLKRAVEIVFKSNAYNIIDLSKVYELMLMK